VAENAIAAKFSLLAVMRYWRAIILRANSATLGWLFGDIRRGIVQLLLFLGATALLLKIGHKAEAAEQVYWLLASAGVALLIYGGIFLFFCVYFPVVFANEQSALLSELNQQTGYSFVPTYQVMIEAVPANDADRAIFGTEMLFRVAIKNTHVRAGIDTYVTLEDMPEKLGISPAARLSAIGKDSESDTFRIAPTETVYVPFLERRDVRNGSPLLVFAADTAYRGTTRITKRLIREYSREGELLPDNIYDGVIAVFGTDALTCRVRFSVKVSAEGEPSISLR
jgi:hypothetical protein